MLNIKQIDDQKNKVKVEVDLHIDLHSFDRHVWRQVWHDGKEAIDIGKPILKEMSLKLHTT